jgi:predicted DNA-binding transcriptional regulator
MLLVKQIQQLGISDKEASIYVALLEMGQATAQQLAAKSGVNRATTYVALENLIKKGLASQINRNKKAHFIIEDPLQFLDNLEKEKNSIDAKIQMAHKIMPELEALERLTRDRAKVKFLEGKAGALLIQKEVMKKKTNGFDNIFNLNLALKFFPALPSDHRQGSKRFKIKGRSLVIYDAQESIPKLPLLWNEQRKYLPLQKFPFYGDLTIFSNKVALISLKTNIMGILIENESLVQGIKVLFELAWQGADHYPSLKYTDTAKK